MDGARLLDGLITREFSFIQELVWSPPYKNPFPLSSHSLLSRLQTLRYAWRYTSATNQNSASGLLSILDADTKTLIDLRRNYLQLLANTHVTADADADIVTGVEKLIDSILVRHMEESWKDSCLELADVELQQLRNINQNDIINDVMNCLELDTCRQCETDKEVGNVTVSEENDQASDKEGIGSGTGKNSTLLHDQSSECDEHSIAVICRSKLLQSLESPTIAKFDRRQSASLADRYSTAASEAETYRSIARVESVVETAGEQVASKPGESNSEDEYYSASSDEEHDSVETRVLKGNEDTGSRATTVAKQSPSKTGESGPLTSREPCSSTAKPVCTEETQVHANNTDNDGRVQKLEHNLIETPFTGNIKVTNGVKRGAERTSSKEDFAEVEMTLRAKICEPDSEEPYWHVIFALLNYSNFKISVETLSYWSLDNTEDIKQVHWRPGEMILREQPSFFCYSIKVPCRASSTSPQVAFSWQYSKFPEWIPTKNAKAEKGPVRKRFGNMISFGDTKRLKHDTGLMGINQVKKRTA